METAKLAYWMNKKKVNTTQLAEKAKLSKGYISNIINGKREGTVKAWKQIAEGLEIELKELC